MKKSKKIVGSLAALAIVAGLSYVFRDKMPKMRKKGKRFVKASEEHRATS